MVEVDYMVLRMYLLKENMKLREISTKAPASQSLLVTKSLINVVH
jgi:hypothetical protein